MSNNIDDERLIQIQDSILDDTYESHSVFAVISQAKKANFLEAQNKALLEVAKKLKPCMTTMYEDNEIWPPDWLFLEDAFKALAAAGITWE